MSPGTLALSEQAERVIARFCPTRLPKSMRMLLPKCVHIMATMTSSQRSFFPGHVQTSGVNHRRVVSVSHFTFTSLIHCVLQRKSGLLVFVPASNQSDCSVHHAPVQLYPLAPMVSQGTLIAFVARNPLSDKF